ncbi:unnamed protein product [Rhizopus stolonifer]
MTALIYTLMIQQSTGPSQRKYIRLIHNGKILNDTQTLKSYGIGKKTSEQPSPFYINCSLSDYIPPKETKVRTYSKQLE